MASRKRPFIWTGPGPEPERIEMSEGALEIMYGSSVARLYNPDEPVLTVAEAEELAMILAETRRKNRGVRATSRRACLWLLDMLSALLGALIYILRAAQAGILSIRAYFSPRTDGS
jgi:hypothetical protein